VWEIISEAGRVFGGAKFPIKVFIICAPAGGPAAVAWVLAPASGGRQKVFQKS
jgi:hypothetical protein